MTTAMIVLVTGGSGLVGCAIQEVLQQQASAGERWVFASSKDADLTSKQSTEQLFDRIEPTHVLHLAAKVGGVYANTKDNVGFFKQNMAMQENITAVCKEREVHKLVSCLSTCIFPDKVVYPIGEASLHEGLPHPSNEGYAFAKRMGDVLNRLYRAQYGCNFTSVIPTNVYGKHDNFNLQEGHVIPCLIHKCFLAKQSGADFVILGSGKPLRQFIYSKDLARLMIWALREYQDASPIILSATEEISIATVAQMIADAFEFKGRMVFDDTLTDGQFKKTVSTQKLASYLPEFQFTSTREALSETVHWFASNWEHVRK